MSNCNKAVLLANNIFFFFWLMYCGQEIIPVSQLGLTITYFPLSTLEKGVNSAVLPNSNQVNELLPFVHDTILRGLLWFESGFACRFE